MLRVHKAIKNKEFFIIRRHSYLLTILITIPIYFALMFFLTNLFIKYFNAYTSFFVIALILLISYGTVMFDMFARDLLLKILDEDIKVNKYIYELKKFKYGIYLPGKIKALEIENLLNSMFNRPRSEIINLLLTDVNAASYYFKKNNDSKTKSEIIFLIKNVSIGTLSDAEAFPYKLDVLQGYYRKIFKKIFRFPVFSIIDIAIYLFYSIKVNKIFKEAIDTKNEYYNEKISSKELKKNIYINVLKSEVCDYE